MQGMADVLFPAPAEQGPGEPVGLGLDEQLIGLQVATARAVDGDPMGELLALVVGGQGRNQLAIPEIGVLVVKAVGTGTTKVNSQNAHAMILWG
ncbi:hypothetical protein D3C79_589300 [compost metagenome]